ncbi:MAG: phage major capsid protein [Candidatus Omnitrophota bacterium]|jgi:HK97 family phage major capsid protein|nr:MAG: phage major capsid protein [Candidatus Omnitrophota bacterium]
MLLSEDKLHGIPQELHRAGTIPLHEGMYAEANQRGYDLTGYLESLDPSPGNAELDAFERQLALAGIRVNGENADIIDRFFASQESAVLFPEFVSRSVRIGCDDFTKLRNILANRIKIDDNTYKSIYMDDSVTAEEEKSLAVVAEGAVLPKIVIKTAEHTLAIKKYGRYLESTYEAIRRKRTSVVALFLRAIGVQLQRDKFTDAIDVLFNGDGNDNAADGVNTAASGTLTYADLIKFYLEFDPYDLNVLLCNKTTASTLLNVTEIKEPVVSAGFQVRGESPRLFGAELLVDDCIPNNKIIGLDRRFALQEVYETGVMTESERLIRRQIEGTAISETAGFAKIIQAAAKVLNVTWA